MISLSLKLPVLQLENQVIQTCDGSKCDTCGLHEKLCYGCKPSVEVSCGTQRSCSTGCETCHGDPPVQGVCCKSPLAPFAVERILTLDQLEYAPVKQLKFPDARIPILLDRHHKSPAKVNCIGINRVYSERRGWKSADIKDYLQLDKSSKLILSTVMTDDHLMRLIETRWWESAPEVGIDYWEPMLFSMFMDEAKMQRLFSFWRTCRSMMDSGAHISPFTFHHCASFNIEPHLLKLHKSVPNIGIGLSHGSEQIDAQRRILGYVRKYAQVLGPNTSWFVQGMTAKNKQVVFKSLLPKGAEAYFFITPLTGRRRTDDQYGWYD